MAGLLAFWALFLVVGSALSFAMVPADPKLQRLLADRAQLRRRIDALLQQLAGLAAKHDRLWLEAERQVRLARGLPVAYSSHSSISVTPGRLSRRPRSE